MGYCQHCDADECAGHTAECSGRSDGRGALDVITEAVMLPPDGLARTVPLNFHRPTIFPVL